jgi:integrase
MAYQYVSVDFNKGRWAQATRSLYKTHWSDWVEWCKEQNAACLPGRAEDVASFLQARSRTGKSVSDIQVHLAAIRAVHKDAKGHLDKSDVTREFYVLDDPCIADAWSAIRRAGKPKTPKDALLAADVKKIIDEVPRDRVADRALVLVGFASLLRRSELSALNFDDIDLANRDYAVIKVRRSKADKFGRGQDVAISRTGSDYCPVTALETYYAWLRIFNIQFGAVFRNQNLIRMQPQTMAAILKGYAKQAGYDPTRLGMHSLRRGGITQMFRNGAKMEDVVKISRHATMAIALGYVESLEATQNPAVKSLISSL